MSEESVGKITLDLELKSDLEGQINKISQLIAENLSKSMEQATKTMFDSINDNMKKSMQSSNNTLKSGLDAMNKTVQSNMKNTLAATSNIKPQQVSNNFPKPNIQKPVINTNFAQPVTRPPPKYDLSQLKAQIEDAERVLNTTNDQIDRQKDKIEQLKVAYDQAFNIAKKSKLSDDLLRAEARLNSLISKSDRYGFKLADLDAKYTAIAEAETRAAEVANTEATAINKVTEATNSNTIAAEKKGTSLKKASDSIKGFIDEEKIMQKGAAATNKNTQAVNSKGKALKSASLNVGTFTNKVNSAIGALSRTLNPFKRLTSSADSGTRSFGRYHWSLGMIARQFVTWMLILPALMRAINALALGLWNDLKTNDQFNTSLQQIKTNLMTAFTPIFYAILPAINAFMSALATITAYIASFLSVIFGSTYQQSFQATQGLVSAKQAMGAYGDSAKKAAKDAKGALMGFDEINQLDIQDNADSGGAGGGADSKVPQLVQPNMDTSAIDTEMQGLADKIKGIFSQIFQPFKEAWNNEGQNTINSAKTALQGIWSLIKSIGESFLKVWTNGTGTQILTTILQIFQNIFNLIGNIAQTFATAWQKGDIGTQIVQALANSFENILLLIKKVGDSLNNVWGSVGTGLADAFMETLNSTAGILEHLTQAFNTVWDNGGSHLFEGILELGAKIIEVAAIIYNQFVAPLVNWFIDQITPAVSSLLDGIGFIADAFKALFDFLTGTGKPAIDLILQALVYAIETVLKPSFTFINNAIAALKEVLQGICEFLTGIFTSNWTQAWNGIKDIVKGVMDSIGSFIQYGLDTILALFGTNSTDLKNKVSETWSNLKETISTKWNEVQTKTTETWNSVKEYLSQKWSDLKTTSSETWSNIKETLSTKFDEISAKSTEIWNGIKDYMTQKWNEIKTAIPTIWDGIKTTFSNKWKEISTASQEVWNGIVKFINETFSGDWSKAWNGIVDIFSKIWNGIKTVAKDPINAVIGFLNGLIRGINQVIKGLDSIHVDIPDLDIFGDLAGESIGFNISPIGTIPALATGGVVDSPTLALLGETKHKEAVLPLEENTGWMDTLGSIVANAVLGGMQFINKPSNPNPQNGGDIYLQIDGTTIARVIKPYTDAENNRLGKSVIIKTV